MARRESEKCGGRHQNSVMQHVTSGDIGKHGMKGMTNDRRGISAGAAWQKNIKISTFH